MATQSLRATTAARKALEMALFEWILQVPGSSSFIIGPVKSCSERESFECRLKGHLSEDVDDRRGG